MEPILPSGYSSRPRTHADIPHIVAFQNAEAIALSGEPITTEEDYETQMSEPGFDVEQDTRVVLDHAGTVVAAANVEFTSPYVRTYVSAVVAREHQARGLGWALTEWGEQRAAQRLHEAPPDAQVVVSTWNLANNTPANTLFEDRGYTRTRIFQAMYINLAENPPTPPILPPGITICSLAERPETDLRAIHRAVRESFADHYGFVERPMEEAFVEWEHYFTSNWYDPRVKFMAFDGDEIAGVALCTPPMPGKFDAGWVDNLAVRRPWRRQGIASALLQHLFCVFHANGTARVGLAVDADSLTNATRLYDRAGMRTESMTYAYQKVLRPGVDLLRR